MRNFCVKCIVGIKISKKVRVLFTAKTKDLKKEQTEMVEKVDVRLSLMGKITID